MNCNISHVAASSTTEWRQLQHPTQAAQTTTTTIYYSNPVKSCGRNEIEEALSLATHANFVRLFQYKFSKNIYIHINVYRGKQMQQCESIESLDWIGYIADGGKRGIWRVLIKSNSIQQPSQLQPRRKRPLQLRLDEHPL